MDDTLEQLGNTIADALGDAILARTVAFGQLTT